MNEQSPPKKLNRSRTDRYVGGVAAGLAARFDIDPIFVRIAFVASLALGGLGLIAYLVLLAVMPVEGDASDPLPPIEPKRRNMMIGLAVIVGIICLATADSGTFGAWLFGFWPGTLFGILFWTFAVGLFVWLLASGRLSLGSRDESKPPSPGSPAPDTTEPVSEPSTEVATFAESPTQVSRTEVMETRQLGATPPPGKSTEPTPVRDDGPSTIGKIMLWFAIGFAALTVFCTLFVVSAGTTALFGGIPMAALVILFGGGMVFAALKGRRQLSLWLLTAAIAVTLPMAAISIADLRVEGSYGEIKETPLNAVDIPEDGYKMAAGSTVIDLRRLDFGSRSVSVPIKSGMGLTSVIVPDHICAMGAAQGKAGVITFRGVQRNGVDVDLAAPSTMKVLPGGPPSIYIDGDFKLGAFEVVDDTEWRQVGRGGSFEHEGSALAIASQKRASAACSWDSSRAMGKAGKAKTN